MQAWVIPLLKKIKPETVSDAVWETIISQPDFAARYIANLFCHCFGDDGVVQVLGDVLIRLPETYFQKILLAYPLFVLLRSPAMVQQIHANRDLPLVVFSQAEIANMSWLARRGAVVHELLHVVRQDYSKGFCLSDPDRRSMEKECDQECIALGFGDEITSVRNYLSERRRK